MHEKFWTREGEERQISEAKAGLTCGRLRATAHPADHPESRTSTLTGHGAAVVLRDALSPRQPPRRHDTAFAGSSSEASSAALRALAQARRGTLRRGAKARRTPPPRRSRAAPRVQGPPHATQRSRPVREKKRERRPPNATLTLNKRRSSSRPSRARPSRSTSSRRTRSTT